MAFRFLSWLLVTLLLHVLLGGMFLLHNRRMFNIERRQMQVKCAREAQRYFMSACREGTKYKDEWRKKGSGFNDKSVTMYCSKISSRKVIEYHDEVFYE